MPPADGPGTELLAQAMAQAIDSLREQLVIANGRAERAERQADQERSLLEELRVRIAAGLVPFGADASGTAS